MEEEIVTKHCEDQWPWIEIVYGIVFDDHAESTRTISQEFQVKWGIKCALLLGRIYFGLTKAIFVPNEDGVDKQITSEKTDAYDFYLEAELIEDIWDEFDDDGNYVWEMIYQRP